MLIVNTTIERERDPDGRFAAVSTAVTDIDLGDGSESPHHIELPDSVHAVLADIRAAGGRPLLVGGSVRDSLLGRAPKDLDFEVYGAEGDAVVAACRRHGKVDEVGKSFGVLKVTLPDGNDLDVSLPRRESVSGPGAGHTGFDVSVDPGMSTEDACARRDFTINAMAYDPNTDILIDHYGGRADLEEGMLRHTSPAFAEDPLRALRGARFAAQLDANMAHSTTELCHSIVGRAPEISGERVAGEFAKMYHADHIDAGLDNLSQTGWDTTIPGLYRVNSERMQGQALTASKTAGDSKHRVPVIAGVIASDMPDDDAASFVRATVIGSREQSMAYELSRRYELPTSLPAARTAAHGPIPLRTRLMVAQSRGEDTWASFDSAQSAGVLDGPEKDLIDGRAVMAGGMKPGPKVGAILADARRAQADREFETADEAKAWLAHRLQ